METKTVNIDFDLFKRVKIYCALNDMKLREFINGAVKKELEKKENDSDSSKI